MCSEIRVVPLGAGQDVGRSCILVSMGGKNIMLDCGMHMGYNDERRFPDFSYITREGPLDSFINCVIVSHFHLDHCGALPYMSEQVGYSGPIYMTFPTKAICPILLEDYRKISVDRMGTQNFFTQDDIKNCMKKVKTMNLHEIIKVDDELEIKAYYAGHVLGAAMILVKVGKQSFVYTGDYNMTSDRHLGAAWIDRCRPDLLITESTYATTIRDSKRCRERDFLKKVHSTVDKGGKVLIPCFALGRAQELCILLETYWERMAIKVPIYFSLGLTEKANYYYQMFITWTSQKIKKTFVERNMFEFKHIKPFDRSYIDKPGPMVVFATPGMLHAGLSLQIFRKWAADEKNMVILPGYCVAGTVGQKILSGQRKIELENKQIIEVKLSVQYMSFSAHADCKGILQLIRRCDPKNVILVHGENEKMNFLREKVISIFGIECFKPMNGETVLIETRHSVSVDMSTSLVPKQLRMSSSPIRKQKCVHAIAVFDDENFQLLPPQEAFKKFEIPVVKIRFTSSFQVPDNENVMEEIRRALISVLEGFDIVVDEENKSFTVESITIKVNKHLEKYHVSISWPYENDEIGEFIASTVKGVFPNATVEADVIASLSNT